MRVIDVKFVRADEWRFGELMDAVGVYVLWSGKSNARPAYIGEGVILHRIVNEHMDNADKISANIFDGMIAVLGYRPTAAPKEEAAIVEALLLDVADDVDRFPVHNKKGGNRSRVMRVFNSHGTLRVNVRGLDPLLNPCSSALREPKQIVLRDSGDIEHDWRLRPISIRR